MTVLRAQERVWNFQNEHNFFSLLGWQSLGLVPGLRELVVRASDTALPSAELTVLPTSLVTLKLEATSAARPPPVGFCSVSFFYFLFGNCLLWQIGARWRPPPSPHPPPPQTKVLFFI